MRVTRGQDYYARRLESAALTFERHEATVSHSFRSPHAFLGGRTYGQALYDAVRREGRSFRHALEVGCGLGDVAHGFLQAWTADYHARPQRYVLLDVSATLQAAQRRRLRRFARLTRFVRADAQKLPFQAGSLPGLVICNEVIAALDARRVAVAERAGARLLDRWDLRAAAPWRRFIFPTGFAAFLEHLGRAATAGTRVVVIDYFDVTGRGGHWVSLRGHRECALDLEVVCHVARRAGFSIKVEPLADFLGLRVTEPVAATSFVSVLDGVFRHRISPSVFWTRGDLSRRLGRRWSGSLDAFFERGEIVRHLSAFWAIRLVKRRALADDDFTTDLVLLREPDAAHVTSGDGRVDALAMAHPSFRPCTLNDAAAFLWDRLDGRRSLGDLARLLARRYGLDAARARQEVMVWARELHRRRYVY